MAFALPATTADGRIIETTAVTATKSHILPMSIRRFAKPLPCSLFHPLLQSKTTLKNSPYIWSAISSSTGAETSSEAEDTASQLDNVVVLDLNGKEIPISDLWKDRKAVVAFARHFGCVLCRKRADYLASEKDKLDAAGVALVLIGPGSVDQAKAFSEQTKFQGGGFENNKSLLGRVSPGLGTLI